MTIQKPPKLGPEEQHREVISDLESRVDHELAVCMNLHPDNSQYVIYISTFLGMPFSNTHLDILALRYEEAGWQMSWVIQITQTFGTSGYYITFE